MKRLVILTGASKGIGAALALEANRRFNNDTIFLLIARDLKKLEQVKTEMSRASRENKYFVVKLDFSRNYKLDELISLLRTLFVNYIDLTLIKELYVFYNHGTLIFGQTDEIGDKVSEQFQINVISVWLLMNVIRRMFPESQCPLQFHVNMSTLMASKAEKRFSVYCTTRSARAAIFKCLALERPQLRVLNYQPGPVYTDMLKQIYDDKTIEFTDAPEFKSLFLF